jgi:hypothetical protein
MQVDGWIVNHTIWYYIWKKSLKRYSELSKQNIHGVHKHVHNKKNTKKKNPKIKAWDVKQ